MFLRNIVLVSDLFKNSTTFELLESLESCGVRDKEIDVFRILLLTKTPLDADPSTMLTHPNSNNILTLITFFHFFCFFTRNKLNHIHVFAKQVLKLLFKRPTFYQEFDLNLVFLLVYNIKANLLN